MKKAFNNNKYIKMCPELPHIKTKIKINTQTSQQSLYKNKNISNTKN